jgi:hypothetical protein
MAAKIKIPYKNLSEQHDAIESWLVANAGCGSVRYGGREGEINHWLNGDDWLYYNQYTLGDSDRLEDSDTVFVFRDERVATEFALRFA